MIAQLDFFEMQMISEPLTLAYQRTSRTSRAAAVAAQPNAGAQRARVLAWLRKQPDGGTMQEVAIGLGALIQSMCPRFDELRKLGEIRDTGKTRPTASGRAAVVWEAV